MRHALDLFNRFNNFQDSILQEVSVKYLKNGSKIALVKLYTKDCSNKINDTWITVEIEILNLLSYKILEEILTTHQIISNGLSVLEYKDSIILEMGDLADDVNDISDLEFSNFYFVGKNIRVMV